MKCHCEPRGGEAISGLDE